MVEEVEEVPPTPEVVPTQTEAEADAAADGRPPRRKSVAEPETLLAKPLAISDADLTALEAIISERGSAVDVVDLLALQYEVIPGDASFDADVQTLAETLKANDRFLYVGAGRFREPNSLPLFVYSLPEFLGFPDLQFISMEGEFMDEEIEDEGIAQPLREEMLHPLAQDAGDDEGRYVGDLDASAQSVRLVLKAHHKEIGTFPLCQVPDGFFPSDAPVAEIVVRDPAGETHDVIVNNDVRLLFNLFGLYEFLVQDSGAVFTLSKGARPYEYRFEPAVDPDPQVFVEEARIAELQALREQAEESGDMATFDLLCEVLAHYAKGLDFVQALTEVNIVRRVTRRKAASILSNYHCFSQKAGQSQWRFDAKKRDLGTDRAKRKYIKR
jgi:hypothetical protein